MTKAAHASPPVVVTHAPADRVEGTHEPRTRTQLARRLAALRDLEFAGEYDPKGRHANRPVYVVSGDTLIGIENAAVLGIRGEHDLFGGVVPHAFVATKAITHPLIAPDAHAPEGWSHAFGDMVGDFVLRGFTAFAVADARRAGLELLRYGPVRLKPVRATAGRGQSVAYTAAELDAVLARLDSAELSVYGLALEENLVEITTYSVGQVRVGTLVASYYGVQYLTPDNTGAHVYGGSELVLARGGFEELLALDPSEPVRLAVAAACAYDNAAITCFQDMFVSRRNYDVAQGRDMGGQPRLGVLEQSWRAGGASGAEVAALEAFHADPSLREVCAKTIEIYGEQAEPMPEQAVVYFSGVDERVGHLTKYAMVEPYGRS